MNVILCNISTLICFQMLGKHVRIITNISVSMLIKLYCWMPVNSCFYSLTQKSETFAKKGRPRFVAGVCSLKCFEIDLICWQLISVKATKRFLGLPFQPTPGKHLVISAFCRRKRHLNFPSKLPGNCGYRCRKATQDQKC